LISGMVAALRMTETLPTRDRRSTSGYAGY
jgi:hypothetical protein